jgi:4-amino-4-deoxy-L-arabinose transferase-like glycosyltransferase
MTAESLPLKAASRTRRVALSWHHAALAGILVLASYLDFAKLAQNGYANTYYAGAVRSMLDSWHNFFFVSFDPGGLVSVDKPPLALWVEAASAKVFGYSGVTILLPEALAGVVAVWLLYLLVARYFGRLAGVIAALALAVSPVSVAVNRDNNPDALFVLLLVAAAYVGARAIESGRLRTLLATAVLVGLAFNTKMLAAAVVVPGLAAGYAFFAPRLVRTRIWHLAVAGLVMVVVSGAWIAAVDLTPASGRPYVGSTTDNSALSLALGYNGLGRVTGQTGGTSAPGGGGAFSGTPGFWRLLNDALGDQGGWLLALAVVGAVSAIVAALLARRRRELGALVVVGGWFLAAAAVFSYSSGIIHTYYVSALAPATAALVGIGTLALWRDVRRGGWWAALPLTAIAAGAWIEIVLLRRSGYLSWLQALVAVVALAALAAVAAGALLETARARALVGAAALAAAVSAFLVAPAAWSATTLDGAVDGTFPGAGPSYFSLGTGGSVGQPNQLGGGLNASSSIDVALAYAKAHDPGTRFALVVSSETEAADAVIRGESVAAMGGFTGRETVLTNAFLARLISSGEARYFLLGTGGGFGGGPGGPGGTNNAAVTTITSTCKAVTSVSTAGGTLYDCAGAASAIAAA